MSSNPVVHQAEDAANYNASAKQKRGAKTARIPIKIVPAETLKKPDWIRVKAGSPTTRFYEIKDTLRGCGEERPPRRVSGDCQKHRSIAVSQLARSLAQLPSSSPHAPVWPCLLR